MATKSKQSAKSGGRTLVALAAALAVMGIGALHAPQAQAQLSIKDSKHNLGTTGSATNNYQFSGTDEVCVFCHTPHMSNTNAVVPIWNRTLPSPAGFTTYDLLGTSSLDGKVAPVGSVSIACLSCHDGVTALNAVINAPGSGLTGNATWQAGTWTTGASTIQPGVTQIGTDLRNDHPIGIQYAGGGYSATNLAGPGVDVDFRTAQTAVLGGGQRVWWVDGGTGGAGTREKSDMLLYTRVAGGGYTGQTEAEPFVECASCHDPHQANNPTFLRRPNTGSDLCLTCHVK